MFFILGTNIHSEIVKILNFYFCRLWKVIGYSAGIVDFVCHMIYLIWGFTGKIVEFCWARVRFASHVAQHIMLNWYVKFRQFTCYYIFLAAVVSMSSSEPLPLLFLFSPFGSLSLCISNVRFYEALKKFFGYLIVCKGNCWVIICCFLK